MKLSRGRDTVGPDKTLAPVEAALKLAIYEYACRRGITGAQARAVVKKMVTDTAPADFDHLLAGLDPAVSDAGGTPWAGTDGES